MQIVRVASFKKGDHFDFSYTPNPKTPGIAATMAAQVKARAGREALADLVITERDDDPGVYMMSTDEDTTDWPELVYVDVWHTDLQRHDLVTMEFEFAEGITYV